MNFQKKGFIITEWLFSSFLWKNSILCTMWGPKSLLFMHPLIHPHLNFTGLINNSGFINMEYMR